MRSIVVLPLMLLLFGGCYSYSTIGFDAVPRGARVSADLTTRGAVANEERLGGDIVIVEGTLESVGPDSVVLNVARTRNRGGSWAHWGGERVAIAQDAVATFRQRKFSVARTAIATAGVAAAIVATLGTDLVGSGDDGRDPKEPAPRPNPGDQ